MRLFVAILFSKEIVDRLSRLRDDLHDASFSGSFVARDNLHLTLEFLGECTPSQAGGVKEIMDGLDFAPFTITMDRLGYFCRPDGDTWWVGIKPSKELMDLQSWLHSALARKGFRLEKRSYKPHITLGRRVHCPKEPGKIEDIKAEVASVSLMLSEFTGRGMAYTELYRVEWCI